MSESPQCLVLWNNRKKVLRLGGQHQKEDLIVALLGSDFRDAVPCDRIEVYNSRFDTFVDIDDDHTFSDGDKIQLVTQDRTVKKEYACPEGLDNQAGTDVLTSSAEGDILAESSSGRVVYPTGQAHYVYKLPDMPFDIKMDIENMKQGELSAATKTRIVTWITTHLRTISLYPGELYERAAKALVHEYPVLRDYIGTGYDSWKVAFQYRMGNIRKSMENVPAIQDARKKYGHKRPAQNAGHFTKQCRMAIPAPDDADKVSAAGHVAFMKSEMKKRVPDALKLKDSMQKTLAERRNWIKEKNPTTAQVLEEYPALAVESILHLEFEELTGINLEKEVLKFVNAHGEKCVHLAKSCRSARDLLKNLTKEMDNSEGDSKKHRFAVAVLNLLPFLVKEKPHFLEGPGVYPSLSTKEDADGSAVLFVTFEGMELEVMDLIAGFVLIMELYWVLNIKYDPRNKNTFGLMEHFCGLPASKSPSLVILRTISAIRKAATVSEDQK